MRFFILFCFCLSPLYLAGESPQENQPSLLEALKMFYIQNGGSIEELQLEEKKEPISKVEGALKDLLQEIKEEQKPVEPSSLKE